MKILVGTYRYADVMDIKQVQELLVNNQIDWLIHLSALLSAIGRTCIPRKAINLPPLSCHR